MHHLLPTASSLSKNPLFHASQNLRIKMRLLEIKANGKLSLTEFVGDNIPRYAILSHTWGPDGEEVAFKDLVDLTSESKVGYNKIRFCGEQAASDGLQYFWIDTCCT